MNTGLVSVMMPAYNAEKYVGEAIQSVLSQTYTNWELIIVNDGSTDGTRGVVEQFTDSRIRLINQPNCGEAAARNRALDNILGEFIAFLDADDQFLPDHLELTVGYLKKNVNLDGVYTDGYYCDQAGTQLQRLSSQRRGPFRGWIFEQLVRASDVFGPPICVALRRELIAKLDLRFDERIVIGPDWDFLTRYAENARFDYIDKPTCLYRVHQSNVTVRTNPQRRAESLVICRKNMIKLEAFSRCSLDVRVYTFYDLLINLLPGLPEEQSNITTWPEFVALPLVEQSRLFRLLCSREIAAKGDYRFAKVWLEKSRALNPIDLRGAILMLLFAFDPQFCGWVLQARRSILAKSTTNSPFGDIF